MAKTYRVGTGTRLVNAVFRTMTRLGLGARYRRILSVRGRTTGKVYDVPVDVMGRDDRRWLVAPYGDVSWVKNARAAGEVTLTRRHLSERLRVTELDPVASVPVLRTYLEEVPVARPYFDASVDATDAELAAEAPRHPVFEISPV